MKRLNRILIFALFVVASASAGMAQMVDGVLGVVGEEVILKSDVESQYAYMMANGQKDDGTLRCQVMEKLVIEKLLLNKADQDSIEVTENEVENELTRRIDYFIQGYGGVENLEEVYQKPLVEIKAELRPEIKNQLLIQRMRDKVLGDISVTPREVRKFYNQIPEDSLPLLPSEVELYHLAVLPKPSKASKAETKNMLKDLRGKIVNGEMDFEAAAKRYSEDFGSAKLGGKLGEFGRGKMVPEFEEIAFQMKVGDISDVFESPFGYHIIKLHKRTGEVVDASHILLQPKRTSQDDSIAIQELHEIRDLIMADSMSFEEAALEFSEDQATKSNGGAIQNPQTGEFRIPHDQLDADFFFKVDKMKEGDITQPMEWIQQNGTRGYHIMYLKKKIPPHTANLKDDYQKIMMAATQAKQGQEMEEWFMLAKDNIYIEINDTECKNSLKNWIE